MTTEEQAALTDIILLPADNSEHRRAEAIANDESENKQKGDSK